MANLEIEVTDEMRKVGAEILADQYDLLGDMVDREIVANVFRAMLEASSLSDQFENLQPEGGVS